MKLIRGAPGSGKTALVFREFKEALLRGRETARIVVPTATLVRHFQHELARDGVVFPPSSVISLSRFASERAPGLKLAPEGLLRAMVRDALRRLNLPEFAEVAATDGMTSTILETIALFENAGATPDKLAGVRKLSLHAKAFEKVWRAVDDAIRQSGLATRAAVIRAAAANNEPLRIWMDGFINFSPLESELVRSLSRSCDLTLTLTDSVAAAEIRHLALQLGAKDRLLTGSTRKPTIDAVAAVSMEREADEIARRILALHSRGTAFREIGVALRDAGTYLPLLRGTMERFGIPARFYFSSPLRTNPAAQFLGGLIEGVLNGWEFSAALDAFRGHPGWGKTAAFDRFDFKVREAIPGRGADELLRLCEEDHLKKRIADCLVIDSWKTQSLIPSDWKRRLEEMAESRYRPGTLDAPRDYRSIETARGQVAAARAWVQAIGSATAFWGDAEAAITLEEFWHVASEAVASATVQVPDDRRDVVHVMSVYEARQWDISALFVCGVTDRDFPKRNPQNLLFPDSDIEALRKTIPLRKAVDQDREEEALFEALKTRARTSLTLTWPAHDASGKRVESSRYLMCLDLYHDAPPVKSQLCRPEPAVMALGSGVSGRIDTPALLTSLAAHHRNISLTGLEDLTQCRFKFFAARTLGLKGRPERPQERLQPKVTGLILHEALEAWLNVGREGDFVELFETAFDKACREKHLPAGYRLEVERIEFRNIAKSVSATEKWDFVSSEAEVDLSLDFPGGITVNCRVDRIDRVNERDCIIVDYKSSKTLRVEQLVESKVKLQGPLYALAARERLNLNTIAMMYVAVREDKRFGWGEVPGVDLNLKPMPPDWIESARDRSIDRIGGFLGGAIQPEPVDPELCVWCDYAQACRYRKQEVYRIEAAHGA